MKRISITTLETYRKFLAGDEYTNQEKMIEAITAPFEGNEYTHIGTAFHSIVEQGEGVAVRQPDGRFIVDGDGYPVTFSEEQVAMALKYRSKLPYAFHEQWISRDFHTPSMDIYVLGRVDVLHGIRVRDIKTKYSPIKLADYTESAQWKFYLDLTGLKEFYFDLFEFKGYKKDKHGHDVSPLKIEPYGTIQCLWYDGIEEENQHLVEDFTDFITRHDLINYLKDKPTF